MANERRDAVGSGAVTAQDAFADRLFGCRVVLTTICSSLSTSMSCRPGCRRRCGGPPAACARSF